ncbi:hypothetical protein SAMN05443549_107158 [Flavobacterium fluvii]|uniref:Uncharacterized protein n=1 Tax=Flavobacterium fluvii TaxID=468056 RepID=A0A1M5N936_9FLAO|nr:hypothetical protein [Flavobacterium fluvii]SHG86106.1 hypothetical protein SAMN05443549_107158 [Flavobacterium fluvii]
MEAELIKTEEVSFDMIYQQDKAQIDTQIATAKAYPRNIQQAVQDSIATVTMDVETASSCSYALPRGGKTLNGPSVHLALILAQNWGNLRIEAKIASIDNKTITSQAVCFDLQKNIAIKVEVKRSIITKTGRMNDDMITVTGNAANSISLRNAILKVIPKAVVDKVSKSAKQLITGDISDETKLIKKRTTVLDGLKNTYGVTEKEVLDILGKPSTANITGEDLVTLIGYAQAIKDGDSTADLIFRAKKVENQNKEEKVDSAKLLLRINQAKTKEALEKLKKDIPEDDLDTYTVYSDRLKELSNPVNTANTNPGNLP